MGSFLEVNEEHLVKKLMLVDNPSDTNESDIWLPGLKHTDPSTSPKILTPSERKEAAQCKFVIPNPGLCVKTRDEKSGNKVFVNLCHSEDVPEPQVNLTDEQLADILDSGTENQVDDIRMPLSIGEKRDEVDKAGVASFACDVIMNSNFFNQRIIKSEMYRTFFIIVAMEGIDEKYQMNLDKNGYKILQNLKSYGKLLPQFLRSKPDIREINSYEPLPPVPVKSKVPTAENIFKHNLVEEVTSGTAINLTVIQVSEEMAKAQAKLPPMVDPTKIEVEIGADRIIVTSPVGSVDIFVPLDIYQEKCRAEFDVPTSTLTLTMPLVVKP